VLLFAKIPPLSAAKVISPEVYVAVVFTPIATTLLTLRLLKIAFRRPAADLDPA
jgi:hypothetical protein